VRERERERERFKKVNELDQGADLASVFLAGPSQPSRKAYLQVLHLPCKSHNLSANNPRIMIAHLRVRYHISQNFGQTNLRVYPMTPLRTKYDQKEKDSIFFSF